jgi:hypothetical protein
MNVKYLFCQAIRRIMDHIKEGKSVTQITTDLGIQNFNREDNISTDHALVKLSEKLLQLRGVTNVSLVEELKDLEDEKDCGVSAFIQIADKISADVFEVISLVEAADLCFQDDTQTKKATKSINEHLIHVGVTDTQKESKSNDLVIEQQRATNALSINQDGFQIEPKV